MTARYENACVYFSVVCITRAPQISHAPATQATISFARQSSNTIFTRFRLSSSRCRFICNFHLQALPIQAFFSEGNFMYVLQYLDCKTVRIFAYSSTREQSNKRSGTRLKTESETHTLRACEARALRARKTLTPRFTDFFTDFEKKTDCFAVYAILDHVTICPARNLSISSGE